MSRAFLDIALGTTICIASDSWDISSATCAGVFFAREVCLEDTHSRHEALANAAEGAVMEFVVVLPGPDAPAMPDSVAPRRNKRFVPTRDRNRGIALICLNDCRRLHHARD